MMKDAILNSLFFFFIKILKGGNWSILEPLKKFPETPCLSYQTPVSIVLQPGPLMVGWPLIEQIAFSMKTPSSISLSILGVLAEINASVRHPSIPISRSFFSFPNKKPESKHIIKTDLKLLHPGCFISFKTFIDDYNSRLFAIKKK